MRGAARRRRVSGTASPKPSRPKMAKQALAINRYFVDHPEMVLGRPRAHIQRLRAGLYLPARPPDVRRAADLLASPRPPAARYLQAIASQDKRADASIASIRVGAAADGATIKEGSYLVHDDQLVQIIDGAPQPVAIRDGKGTEGIPAKHARIIRGADRRPRCGPRGSARPGSR